MARMKMSKGSRGNPRGRGRGLNEEESAQGRGRRHRGNRGGDGAVVLYGLHAVAAALDNPERDIMHLTLTENAAASLEDAITRRGVQPEVRTSQDLTRLLGNDTVHQGAALKTRPLPDVGLEAVYPTPERPNPHVLVLDQVTDPHNVGAIIRSAAVFGAAGLVMTRRNSAPLDGVTAKAASGGLEHLPVVFVGNLAQAMRDLARDGFRMIGLDGDCQMPLTVEHGTEPMALVLGAEGTGLRRLTRETCDELCHLPTAGPLRSLNVSNAAAVALALTLQSS